MDPYSMDLFQACSDGLVFCKLVNMAVPDTVDDRALNTRPNMSVFQKTENNNLAINAAKSIGCKVTNIGANDLLEGRPILVMGLIWQIIRIQLLSNISLKQHPELIRLLHQGETLEDLMKLPPEQILIRWFNFHLKAANHPRRIQNFGPDLKDSECYSVLMHQLAPNTCDYITEDDSLERADHVLRNAERLGVPHFIKKTDIVSGNRKLNMGFCAQIFNTCPGLEITAEELEEYDFAGLEIDDVGDSREERVFRMWVNSLGDETMQVNNLFTDVENGLIVLKVIDKVEPRTVDWTKVNMVPRNKWKRVENCNYAVVLGKKLGFSLVGIGGIDLADKNKNLVLAFIWQLMRYHTLKMLTELGGGARVGDRTVVNWANQMVRVAGRERQITSFRDRSLATGLFLLDLCAAIEPRAINWEYVTDGVADEDAMSNARYAISVARRIGASVFVAPEDIVEVKSKMIMTYVASCWAYTLNRSRS
eukprot:scaffold1023_cov313-Pinguiococcus_pyrenoidosus.AAC.22